MQAMPQHCVWHRAKAPLHCGCSWSFTQMSSQVVLLILSLLTLPDIGSWLSPWVRVVGEESKTEGLAAKEYLNRVVAWHKCEDALETVKHQENRRELVEI